MSSILNQLTLPIAISIGSLVLAIVSTTFGWFSFQTSRRALALSQRSSSLADANASVSLLDAFRYRVSSSELALYVFVLTIASKSTAPNSIVAIELRVSIVKDNVERTIVMNHSAYSAASSLLGIKSPAIIPSPLPARGAIALNCVFEISDNLLAGADYGPFDVRVIYAEGPPSEIRANVIMDVINAEHLEKKRKSGVPV